MLATDLIFPEDYSFIEDASVVEATEARASELGKGVTLDFIKTLESQKINRCFSVRNGAETAIIGNTVENCAQPPIYVSIDTRAEVGGKVSISMQAHEAGELRITMSGTFFSKY